jgi:hypothetical protein
VNRKNWKHSPERAQAIRDMSQLKVFVEDDFRFFLKIRVEYDEQFGWN